MGKKSVSFLAGFHQFIAQLNKPHLVQFCMAGTNKYKTDYRNPYYGRDPFPKRPSLKGKVSQLDPEEDTSWVDLLSFDPSNGTDEVEDSTTG